MKSDPFVLSFTNKGDKPIVAIKIVNGKLLVIDNKNIDIKNLQGGFFSRVMDYLSEHENSIYHFRIINPPTTISDYKINNETNLTFSIGSNCEAVASIFTD